MLIGVPKEIKANENRVAVAFTRILLSIQQQHVLQRTYTASLKDQLWFGYRINNKFTEKNAV